MSVEFLEPVLQILEKIKSESGKEVLLVENNEMAAYVEAKIAGEGDENHYISFSPKGGDMINHTVAAKALQILRVCKTPSEERKTAVAYQEHLNTARMSIALEVEKKPHLQIAMNDHHMTSTWILSLINQLISQPASINVEREIYESYPELKEFQRASIEAQFNDFNLTLSKEVEQLSPSIIYNSSAIMNYVYLRHMDDILGTDYISRLNYIVKKSRSEKLYNYTRDNLKDNVISDMEMIDYWAETLGIKDWYLWTST